MVSKASEDLPDPESPVMTVRAFRGISTVMFLRLCSRAPRTTNDSLDIDSEPTRVLASRSTLPNLLLNPRRFPTLALPHGSGRAGRADHPRHRGGRSPAGDGAGGGTARGLRHARAGSAVDLPLGGRADGGGRGARGPEDRCVEVGCARRGRARAAPLRSAGAVGIAGRARAGPLPCVAHDRGGRVMHKREPRWQSAADRARVAAELLEEAESLSENSTIATPAEVARASLPPPIRAELPDPAPPAAPEGEAPAGAATAAPGLDELVAREPDNVGLLLQRAEVLCGRRHFTAAQRDLERALRLEPGNMDALATLGLVLSRKGLWIEAAAQFKSVVELDPGRTAAWYYLGEALNHVDDLAGALTAFERAAELEPGNPNALYGCGIVLDRLNRPAEATQMRSEERRVGKECRSRW